MGKLLLSFILMHAIAAYGQQPQTYSTVSNGNWSAATTWSGGRVPSCMIDDNAKVIISHTVQFDVASDIDVMKGDLRLPGGRLNFPLTGPGSGRSIFIRQQGRFYMFSAELNMPITPTSVGSFSAEKGHIDIISSSLSIAENWVNIQDHLEIIQSCIRIGKSYMSDHSHEILDRTCLEIGLQGNGDFDNDRGNIKVFQASILLRGQTGNFYNRNQQSKIEHHGGSNGIGIMALDVPGNLENNGLWKATILQHCIDGNIQGSAANEIDFLNAENCAYVNAQFCDACSIQESPLPVTLISFNAISASNNHRLYWNVTNEVDMEMYAIERSSDGRNFTRVGALGASGNTQYNFNIAAVPGTVYYRLKMLDVDGSYEYSRIIRVNSKQMEFIDISPNPFSDQLRLNINIPNDARYGFRIIDASGKMVQQKEENLARGMHSIDWQGLRTLAPGMYTLIITEPTSNFIHSEKLVKRE